MVPKIQEIPVIAQPEEYDFAYAQLKILATLRFYNAALRRYKYHIDLSNVYRGNSFNLSETNAPLYPRYLRLKQALEKPGRRREAHISAPMRSGIFSLSSPETFNLLCHSPHYPYYRSDIDILKHHEKIFAKCISGRNLFEPCGGFGEKITLMLSRSLVLNSIPKRVIINDTEETNINHALTGLSELLIDIKSANPRTQLPKLIGVRGDWLDTATYLLSNAMVGEAHPNIQWLDSATHILRNTTVEKVRPNIQENILETLRSDEEDTVVFLPGAMANDFFPNNLHKFLKEQFKPGTLFCVGYDGTIKCDLLTNIYKGNPKKGNHPLVQQLALNGITHACWDNLGEEQADCFDPRLIGISVDAMPVDENTSYVQISAFTKNRPDRRVYFHPIIKAEHYESQVTRDGFEVVTTLHPSSQAFSSCPTRYAMHLFTHKGFAEKYRASLEA
jgi:hypothetical protein